MNYFMICALVGFLSGCNMNAEQDLADIAYAKKDCAEFKKSYQAVQPIKVNSNLMDLKIKRCKDVGAWE